MTLVVDKRLLDFLLETATKDELTGLWALGYELERIEKNKAKETELIKHITENLNALFDEPNENDIEYDKTYETETEKDIQIPNPPTIKKIINKDEIQTILDFVNENNPLFDLEDDLKSNRPMSAPRVNITNSFNTKENQRPMSAPVFAPAPASAISKNQSNKLPTVSKLQTVSHKVTNNKKKNPYTFTAWEKNNNVSAAAGIKKSRRKRRKRTKRKLTKRKRTKRKLTKRKRTKRKRTKRKRTKRKHKGGSSQSNICSYTGPDENILIPLEIGWGVNIRKKNSELAANVGCGENTGNLVLNLLCNNEDNLSVVASPGPDFSLKHPITRWKTKNKELKDHLDKTNHKKDDVYVVILEDENFYKQTDKLKFYRQIRPENRKTIHGIDMRAHTVEMFKSFIEFIEEKKIEKSIIIIHCFCGAGRTSSMVMCCKLYFLIEFYLTKNPISDEDRKNIVLDIPSLIGFPRGATTLTQTGKDDFNSLKTNIRNSPAGKWLTKNYTSTAHGASAPGKEFLEIKRKTTGDGSICTFYERLFFKRVSNISKALGHHFKFKYIMTLDEYGCRVRLRNKNVSHIGENASEYFGKTGTDPTGNLEFILYKNQ